MLRRKKRVKPDLDGEYADAEQTFDALIEWLRKLAVVLDELVLDEAEHVQTARTMIEDIGQLWPRMVAYKEMVQKSYRQCTFRDDAEWLHPLAHELDAESRRIRAAAREFHEQLAETCTC